MSAASHPPVQSVVIVGGGTAGWIAAAALAKTLGKAVDIRLIESDAIGTVGVGEATIPQLRRLNAILGINEHEFVRATKGSFKLGIEFNNWGHLGERYLHTFGDAGINLQGIPFHHYWRKYSASFEGSNLWDYSLHHRAAYAHKFGQVERVGRTSMTGLAYAYHFDATAYALFLRKLSEPRGVVRTEGKVVDVTLENESGHVASVTLESGEIIAGDLFIDCTGFRGLLIGGSLDVAWQDWSHWLPVDRAVTVPCERTDPLLPYTKATAHGAGWQWRIPLQHRTGNGHVYVSDFLSDDEATQTLLDNLDAPTTAEPRLLRFKTGRREQLWHKNVVSLGLASGFLEPLESTSIHIIQSNVSRLIELFPNMGFSVANITEYNRVVTKEYDLIRDFLILHYARTDRNDTPFWRHCANMEIPDSLRHKIDLFRTTGHLFRDPEDLFRESSWVQVMLGQGIMPEGWHRHADQLSDEQLGQFMADVQAIIAKTVNPLPSHADFIAAHCAV
ncbi:tryptophan halogenase [Algimonas ampicilliniresistens]|uniref:Tryptophan halogenase n=1 Tax=Algimonas ampicilliniresistens TaxID=1298735 RepID=A0ABQ5V8I2_9PROT|nr:tryptophan halogenase family protein [Algimonas ampicilliniresistens]GLQ23758.1 tryptophan halogenase [Algimonas ampicilliniresistens]